jgi:hypothetical protein
MSGVVTLVEKNLAQRCKKLLAAPFFDKKHTLLQ